MRLSLAADIRFNDDFITAILMALLKQRLILGPVLIALLLAACWLDDRLDRVALDGFWQDMFNGRQWLPAGLALFTVAGAVVPLAAWELVRIFRANGIPTSTGVTIAAAETGLVLHYCIPDSTRGVTAVAIVCTGLVFVFVLALAFYSRNKNVEGVVAAAGGTMFAMIYLGLMFGFLLAIRRYDSAWIIAAILLITKSCDIGAYFTGKAIGRHKMIAWLSPGKTWEGLAGGVVFSAIVATALGAWGRSIGTVDVHEGTQYHFGFAPWQCLAAGVLFALTGQAGDLTASLLKRDAGLKDSSRVLPGFGGVLDVVDSPLLVAPVAYWLLQTWR